MNDSLCILVRRAPYGTIHAAEAFRHLVGALSFGLKVTMILVDDGVYMAKENQKAETFGWTSLSKSLNAFLSSKSGKNIKVYIHNPSIKSRGIKNNQLIKGIELINDERLVKFLGTSHSLMLF
jgi:sulfur relay (sulfurtransferase) DsrF/TusC family protein